ncbi:hypothetical protein WICPIJ_006653 [Wickerhamomyces pijperi]|uniref:Protein YOP1 n=1 Tax=Wickerhamomyces pijperi TaxID=599730 RepID=A0A9P8Q3V5_WICPI|nr:hypothetical protein WICPIJ_006653 [Wickerhamomyces pijperi]
MSDFVNQFQSTLQALDKKFEGNSVLSQFEAQTKLPKSYAILSSGAFYFLLIFINIGGIGQLLSNVAGFVVPGYLSLLALNTPGKDDDTQLLTYWVVFAFLNIIEFWSKAILYWIPFYWFIKTIFLLYLALPQFNGASLVYTSFLKPFADQYILDNKSVEAAAKDFAKKVDDVAEGVSSAVKH